MENLPSWQPRNSTAPKCPAGSGGLEDTDYDVKIECVSL